MENSQTPALEEQLHRELGEIGREISRLVAERDALKRILTRVYREQSPGRKLPRSDGHERHLVETRVLEVLRAAQGKAVSGRELLAQVRKSHPGLKEPTFRSQLHRLKKRALIAPLQDRRGHWHFQG